MSTHDRAEAQPGKCILIDTTLLGEHNVNNCCYHHKRVIPHHLTDNVDQTVRYCTRCATGPRVNEAVTLSDQRCLTAAAFHFSFGGISVGLISDTACANAVANYYFSAHEALIWKNQHLDTNQSTQNCKVGDI